MALSGELEPYKRWFLRESSYSCDCLFIRTRIERVSQSSTAISRKTGFFRKRTNLSRNRSSEYAGVHPAGWRGSKSGSPPGEKDLYALAERDQ